MKRGIFSFSYYIIRRKGQESRTVSFPLKNFLKDEGIIFGLHLFIMERHHQRHVILSLQVFHFLPGEVVGPEGKFSSSCLEETAGLSVTVNASGEEDSHIRMVQNQLTAGGSGKLSVGEEIDISFFNGFVIPALKIEKGSSVISSWTKYFL